MMNKELPYNTGKVRIGCNYVPPMRSYMSDNDIFWQSVLLGQHRSAVALLDAWLNRSNQHA